MRKTMIIIYILFNSILALADETLRDTVHLFEKVNKELSKDLTSNCNYSSSELCELFTYFSNKGVPNKPLMDALVFYQENSNKLKNKRYISIADYSLSSTKKRFFLLDIENRELKQFKVSHGSGSGPDGKMGDKNHDGYLDRCMYKNSRQNMTRPGFFVTGELYKSYGSKNSHIEVKNKDGEVSKGWPYIDSKASFNALRLDGLSIGVNDKARPNGVVMHGAWYNNYKVTKTRIMGRSYGCPAFSTKGAIAVIPKIKNGSLYYSYVPKCKQDMKKVKSAIRGNLNSCPQE